MNSATPITARVNKIFEIKFYLCEIATMSNVSGIIFNMNNPYSTAMRIIVFVLSVVALYGCTSKDEPTVSLYLAVHRGDIEQISRHIRAGADMNQIDVDGNRPLHVAAQKGQIAITRLLLKHDVDVNATNKADHTPIYYAILNGQTRLADLLLKQGAELDANYILLEAARNDIPDRDAINYLVSHGANLEATNTQGDTALITAVRHTNHRLARHLVTQGANVNAHDATGKSVLQIANELGLDDIALLLKRNGAQ